MEKLNNITFSTEPIRWYYWLRWDKYTYLHRERPIEKASEQKGSCIFLFIPLAIGNYFQQRHFIRQY
jgi:hypothetical protein